MPGRSKIEAGSAFVRLFMDDKAFRRTLQGAAKRLKSFGANVATIGAKIGAAGGLITAPFGAALKIFADTGDQLDKMAARTGFTVETLSELAFAASQSGASLEDVEKASKGMARTLLNAADGSKLAVDTLDQLGLSLDSLQGKNPEDQFNAIALAISDVADPTTRAALAMRVFGKSGSALLPMLNGGADGMAALRAQAQELGIVMTRDEATAAAAVTDALDQLGRQTKAAFLQLGAAVAGPLTAFLASTRNTLATIIDWAKQNKGLVAGIALVGVVLTAAGVALTAFGGFVILAGSAVSGLATLLGILTSPLVLVAGLVVGLGVAFVKFTATGSAALDFLKAQFGPLAETVSSTVSAIGDALARGDISAAAGVLWASLKLIFAQGVAKLREYWAGFKNFYVETATAAFYGAQEVLANATATGQSVMTQTWDFIRDGWTVLISAIQSAWAGFVNFLDNSWQRIKSFVGFSTEEAAQAAIDANNRALESTRSAIQDRQNETIGGRDQARREKLAQVEADRQRELERIARDRAAAEAANRDSFAGELAGADRGVAEAKAAFEAARQTAVGDPAAPAAAGGKSLKDTLAEALEAAQEDASAIGSPSAGGPGGPQAAFSTAFAAQMFGSGDVQRDQLSKLTEIAANTDKMKRKPGGLAVGTG